jgi:transposase InsO family protein
MFHSDNGGEFTFGAFNAFCELHGIARHFTNFYSPQQNGVSKQKNKTLMEFVQSMFQSTKLSKSF